MSDLHVEEQGQKAYERIVNHTRLFAGLCDEIYTKDGSVYFCVGADEYSLWYYTILNSPIIDVFSAVKRWKENLLTEEEREARLEKKRKLKEQLAVSFQVEKEEPVSDKVRESVNNAGIVSLCLTHGISVFLYHAMPEVLPLFLYLVFASWLLTGLGRYMQAKG